MGEFTLTYTRPCAAVVVCVLIALPAVALTPAASATPGPVAGASTMLSNPNTNATSLVLQELPAGGAVAAWVETNYTAWSIYASMWDGQAWSVPARLVENTSAQVRDVQLALDGLGFVTLAWTAGALPNSFFFAQMGSNGSWSPPALLTNATMGSVLGEGLHMRAAETGRLYFSWMEAGTGPDALRVVVVDPATGMDGPLNLTNGSRASASAIAVAPSGDAVIAWCEWNGAYSNLTWAQYETGTGWGQPTLGVQNVSDGCNRADALTSASDVSTFLIAGTNATGQPVLAVEFTPPSSWGAPVQVGSIPGAWNMNSLRLKPVAAGGMIASWTSSYIDFMFFMTYGRAEVAIYDPAGGWGTAALIGEQAMGAVVLAVAAHSTTSAVAAVGKSGSYEAGPRLAQLRALPGCSGWSDLGPAVGAAALVYDVALYSPSAGSGFVLYTASNYPAIELRWAPFTVPSLPGSAVTAPQQGATVGSAAVDVKGTTQPNATLSIANASYVADAQGAFNARVALLGGDNDLTVRIAYTGEWLRCTATLPLHVTFQDPVPALQAQLAGALANVTALQAALSSLEASGNATAAELALARASLSLAINDVAEAQAQLQVAEDRTDAMASNVTRAEASAAAAQARADAASAGLGLALLLGGVGLALGAAGLGAAVWIMRVKEKGNRTKSEPSAGVTPPTADELKVKEKGNR